MIRAALAALIALSCAPHPNTEFDAVVVILSADPDRHPCCSAVATFDRLGLPVLSTAAHCVEHALDPSDPESLRTAAVGEAIWFLTRDAVQTPHLAEIAQWDRARDRATLITAAELPRLRRREISEAQAVRAQVHAVSGLYGWSTHWGEINGSIFTGANSHFFTSDLTIVPGWSGSPVIDGSGYFVGIVTACTGSKILKGTRVVSSCLPNWAVLTSAP